MQWKSKQLSYKLFLPSFINFHLCLTGSKESQNNTSKLMFTNSHSCLTRSKIFQKTRTNSCLYSLSFDRGGKELKKLIQICINSHRLLAYSGLIISKENRSNSWLPTRINSHSRFTGRKIWYKLLTSSSHQLSSLFDQKQWKSNNSHTTHLQVYTNSRQLSFSFDQQQWKLRQLSYKLLSSSYYQLSSLFHQWRVETTLVQLSYTTPPVSTNSYQLLCSFETTLISKLLSTSSHQLPSLFDQKHEESEKNNSHTNTYLLTLINSRSIFTRSNESRNNCHVKSCLPTSFNPHPLDQKQWQSKQTLVSQLLSTLILWSYLYLYNYSCVALLYWGLHHRLRWIWLRWCSVTRSLRWCSVPRPLRWCCVPRSWRWCCVPRPWRWLLAWVTGLWWVALGIRLWLVGWGSVWILSLGIIYWLRYIIS